MNARQKPQKPYPTFPLGPASNGQWQKKIGGVIRYFGKWEDPDAALAKYQAFIGQAAPESESDTVPAAADAGKTRTNKPAKPRKDFPLYAHSNGQWAARIRGKIHYFGPWDDPTSAIDRYLDQKDHLKAGRKPRKKRDGLTVSGLVNRFLSDMLRRVETNEMKQRTFDDYKKTGERVGALLGYDRLVEDLEPEDFETLRTALAVGVGPVTLGNEITRARVIFKYADTVFRIRVHYGVSFKKPGRLVLRRDRNSKPKKSFEAVDIRRLIAGATVPMKAMILLGINCGFGNHDCATIEKRHLDLEKGWHTYPRPKTEVVRRFPLWPETVKALQAAIDARPDPKDPSLEDRVFITSQGNAWDKPGMDNPISKEMAKLLATLGLTQAGRGFYALRHTFQTVGDGSGVPHAVSYAMGHAPKGDDMAAVYREFLFGKQLKRVSNHVHAWLFGVKPLEESGSRRANRSQDKRADASSGSR